MLVVHYSLVWIGSLLPTQPHCDIPHDRSFGFSMVLKNKRAFLGTVKVTSPPIFSFIGPFSPPLALIYIYSSWRTPVVWPAAQGVPVGTLMELDPNAGNQTLKPLYHQNTNRGQKFPLRKNKKTSARRYRWWWSTTKYPPTEGVLVNGAVSDISRTLFSPRSFLVLTSCASESPPASSTA